MTEFTEDAIKGLAKCAPIWGVGSRVMDDREYWEHCMDEVLRALGEGISADLSVPKEYARLALEARRALFGRIGAYPAAVAP